MSHLTINHLATAIGDPITARLRQDEAGRYYAYVEIGECKPYHGSIVAAARRRGIDMVRKCDGVYYAYASAAAAPPLRFTDLAAESMTGDAARFNW